MNASRAPCRASVALVLALALQSGVASCSSSAGSVADCVPSDARCDGSVAYWCTSGADHERHLISVDCGSARYCVNPSNEAFCAAEPTPSAQCPTQTGDTAFCDGTNMIACSGGYVVARYSCSTCGPCVGGSDCPAATPLDCGKGLYATCGSDADCLGGYVCLDSHCAVDCGSQPWCPAAYCSSSTSTGSLVQGCFFAVTEG